MKVETGKNIHLGAIDDVGMRIGQALQDRASHVAVHALVERWIRFKMSLIRASSLRKSPPRPSLSDSQSR